MDEKKKNEPSEQVPEIEKEESTEPLDSEVEKQQEQQNEEIKVKKPFSIKIVAIVSSVIAVVTIAAIVLFGVLGSDKGNDNNGSVDDGEGNLPVHIHNYGDWVTTKEATCEFEGIKERICSCGEKENESIFAKGHNFSDWMLVKEATCAEEGTEAKICACGEKETRSISKNNEHNVVSDDAVESTCTGSGLTEGSHCSVCGTVFIVQTETPKKAHTYDDKYDESCNICGYKRDADCSHSNIVVIPGKSATCIDAGLTEGKKCSKCGEILESQTTINAKGHTNGAWVTDSLATCTESGSKHQVCSVCNATLKTEAIVATGHTNGAWITDKSATCTESGSKHQVCSVCNKTVNTQTISATGHSIVTDAAVSPTCTVPGKTAGSHCSTCGYVSVAQTTVNAKGHSYNDGVVTAQASCVQNGVKKFTCTTVGCGHSYTESFSLQSYSATELYNQASKFVGEIVVYDKKGIETSLATGFVYTSDGKIITNYHVIDEAYSAVITINGTTYAIKQILAFDKNIDLAILKIDATGLIAANVCKQPVKTGETVYAIGSSRGLTNTYSQGIITYADRVVDGVSHIQHDASITHGNSGGPLINVYGEVIGINTWGISDSQNLNFAVFTDEIDNLVYGQAMSLADFYNMNHSAYDTLLNWVLENYNYTGDGYIEYRYQESGERFSLYTLTYFQDTNVLSIIYYYVFNNDDARYVSIDLSKEKTSCRYYATYTDGDYSYMNNVTQGHIYPSSFTRYTSIGYYSFEGDYWTESSLLKTYQEGIVFLLDWFDWATVYYDTGVTIEDFGFDAFEKNSDSQSAKDLLIESVLKNGEYNAEYNWYNVREKYDYSNKTVYYNTYYHIETGNLTLQKAIFYDSGEYWNTYLSLEPTSLGMYYSCTFKEEHESGAGYEIINDTCGYINPKIFTKDTVLTYKEYNGAENKKSTFLGYYAEDISDLLNWAYYYFDKESLDITFSDLGF